MSTFREKRGVYIQIFIFRVIKPTAENDLKSRVRKALIIALFNFRHRKCMQCYSDLVKTRALILKRQSMQGKLGHSMRELAILMQYID